MDRKSFGKLVASLRKELFDEAGNRLTQANLAQKAATLNPQTPLNEIIIGKIERGERAILDDQTLLSLADALELLVGERREFFLAATGLDNPQIFPSPTEAEAILDPAKQMLADIQLPAFLVDTYLDVIAVNGPLIQLFDVSKTVLIEASRPSFNVNLLHFLFSDAFEQQRRVMRREQWDYLAMRSVMYFRRMTLPYRMTGYFEHLMQGLRRFRDFRWYWEQIFYEEQRYFVGGESYQMQLPLGERFSYLTAPLITLTPFGNLEINTFVPRNWETAVFFHHLAQKKLSATQQLSTWPYKQIA